MKNLSFRQYRRSPKSDSKEEPSDAKDKESAAYSKRREQVRKAQRAHRDRNKTYIKSLESEVLQLRTNEAKILQESRSLQREVERLKELLDQHGISYFDDLAIFGTTHAKMEMELPTSSSIYVLENPLKQQQLHIGTSGEFYLTESEGSQLSTSSNSLQKRSLFGRKTSSKSTSVGESSSKRSVYTGQPLPSEASGELQDVTAVAQSMSNLQVKAMDPTDLGMEFIFTLEAPCLHHMQGNPSDPEIPSGHALTASATFLYQSPTQPVDTHAVATPFSAHHHQWETPKIGLEKLLSLSSTFDLYDEITPVQAWHHIRSHTHFETLGVVHLRELTKELLTYVKCYGLGAVLDADDFMKVVGRVLPNNDAYA